MAAMGMDFETVLDRRLNDFEKLVDTKLTGIEKGFEEMRGTMAVFIGQVANMHKEYKSRADIDKDETKQDKAIEDLQKDIKRLTAWRNYLTGAIGIIAFVLGLLVESHFWK